jgi:hypothetical protein
LVTLLRKEMAEKPELVLPLALNSSYKTLVSCAAA